jgi:hypothetical protein
LEVLGKLFYIFVAGCDAAFLFIIKLKEMSMNSKSLIRMILLMALLVSFFGTSVPVSASSLSAQIVIRSTTFWDATFNGSTDVNRFERWSLQIEEASSFRVTVTTVTGDLTPKVLLLNSEGVEITQVVGTLSTAVLNTSQVAGDYFIQVQPESGAGTYSMEIRRTDDPVTDPNATIVFNPASIFPNEISAGTLMLNNVPVSGFASAEFTCTYDPALISITNITQSGLFGTDPVVILNGPSNGTFLFAIAGSNGQKATASGAAFTFTATGLLVGDAEVSCVVKVSAGNSLSTIESTPTTLSILEPLGTLTGTVIANELVTITLYNPDDSVAGTTTVDANGNFELQAPAGAYTVRATAPGFLPAEGDPTLTPGGTTTMQTINLVSGDIDGNGVIDQFDALTIGINYNASSPSVADLNNDGVINVLDLEILASNYRANGALNWLTN